MNKQDFIKTLLPMAQAEQRRTGVLTSIKLAQACLETGYGRAVAGGNLYGIKGSGQTFTTHEYYNGVKTTVQDSFRAYPDWAASVIDHSEFLLRNGRYSRAGFFTACKALDYKGAARALQSAGYATDPQYAKKLISIIEANGFAKYDQIEEEVKEDEDTMKLEHDWQWKQLGDALDGLYRAGKLSDYSWVEKAYTRQLTISEVSWLNTVILARQSGVEV
ncbi:glycoside hydrolase family 73 protein [Paenibacillus caseinilyticus]|uniref:glycoside hydrolase family 73 protein n=1 Tax=Paenibacillus caseinilyticus TaxID=3098138 RepID=UPI0022B89B2C|nr:glycoside hydrolase family 73 protein [Paenibacillus caseinilyticus]MCZ8518901.1 glycoside hydrolase family 73 protein [Paenibacillus caseinilyticus]